MALLTLKHIRAQPVLRTVWDSERTPGAAITCTTTTAATSAAACSCSRTCPTAHGKGLAEPG